MENGHLSEPPEPGARDRLIQAAITLFSRKGYHATSVREICDAAGVTKPVLYYWFRNKEGIFQEIMRPGIAEHEATLAEVLAAGGPVAERILTLGERFMDVVIKNAELVRLIDSIYYGPREGAPAFDFDRLYGGFDEAMAALVKEGIATGEFRAVDVETAVNALLGAFIISKTTVHLCEDTAHCLHDRPLSPKEVRRVLDLVLDGIRAGGPAARKDEA